MITKDNFKDVLLTLGFEKASVIGLLYHKRFTISKVNGYITIKRMPCKV